MHLFLCGGGSGKQLEDSYKKLVTLIDFKKPIIYIPFALPEERLDSCYEWFSQEVKYLNNSRFIMVKDNKELSKLDFENYSMIFIGGGNTFKLLKDLREYKIDEKIKTYLDKEGIVFGGSAGAIVFGKTINTVIKEDDNFLNVEELDGFNLAEEKSLICHLNEENLLKNDALLKSLSFENEIYYLNEDNVLYYTIDDKYMFGKNKFYVYKNGKRKIVEPDKYNS